MNPPNFIVIVTDQQRTDSLSAYGSRFTATPNIDRLAAEGARFDRAYCCSPVCTPSRASLFSGLRVSRHGAWNIGVNVPDDVPMLSHRLAAAGYQTHYIGKAHFQAFDAAPEQSLEARDERNYPAFRGPYYGFETVELSLGHATYGLGGHYGAWVRSLVTPERMTALSHARQLSSHWFGGDAYDWDIPLRLHNSVWTADRAVAFLEQQHRSQPFLLAVGFQDPHHPHCVPTEYSERLDAASVPLPDYLEGELDDKPPFFLEARRGVLKHSAVRGRYPMTGQHDGADFRLASESDQRLGRAYYYTLVKLIDREVGRILDALDQRGLAQNTFVVFTTDHGELLGDHGLWMKGPFHYECVIRVPLLMRWPAGFDPIGGVGELVSHVDVAPTLLAAAGLSGWESLDGLSALLLLRRQTNAIRDHVLVECTDDPERLRLKSVVTHRRKLTFYQDKNYGELYDLDGDPREKANRFDDIAYSGDRAELQALIDRVPQKPERRAPRLAYA